MSETVYDFVIVGSGLGGLTCAYLLANEGYSVCVLEKNHQIGGTLQVFSRQKAILDTGVHYIGSLDEGETMYQLFKHFGILDSLKLQRLDEGGFDIVELSDGFRFPYGQGHAQFKENLLAYFPEEVVAITRYLAMLEEVSSDFPLYELRSGTYSGATHWHMEIATSTYLEQLTTDQRLREVLAATNAFLYAGVSGVTPLYVHALVQNSYLKGAYRLVDGGSQIAIALSRQIRQRGGIIRKRCEVVSAIVNSTKQVEAVVLSSGEQIKGKNFISNLHPSVTLQLFGEQFFLKPFRKRIQSLPNTLSCFMVHIVFHDHSFPYLNHNIYKHHQHVWSAISDAEQWPAQYFISTPATSRMPEHAESMSVMCYMSYDEVQEWSATFNTKTHPNERGAAYTRFKLQKEECVLLRIESMFPGIRQHIAAVHSCTPLTWRDYLASPAGSMYGLQRDANHPLKSQLNTQTHLQNLFLTGQNLVMHGILGVSIGALVTCSHFIDRNKLLADIARSNQV